MSAVATAIIGSAVVGAGTSIHGANQANKAAERNQENMYQNIGAANQAVYHELPNAFDDRWMGADIYSQGLGDGQNAWWDRMAPVADQWQYGINEVRAGDPNYTGQTQFNRPTDFNRDTEIGGHWNQLESQNFMESPDYQFRLDEGINAVQNSAAAQGGLYSGNTLRGIVDFASNLAAGEYGNWFARQQGIDDRNYGADVANYDRESDQFGQNYNRANEQFGQNFARDYGVYADDWGREQDRGRWLADTGRNALQQGAGIDYNTQVGAGQAYADVYGASAQDRINAGNAVGNNWMGGAGYAANQPYVSPWGGVNNAIQTGLENWMWYQPQMGGQQQQPFSTGPQWEYGEGGYRG